MTDYEKWKEFLESFGIVPEVGEGQGVNLGNSYLFVNAHTPKVVGYNGFSFEVKFDVDGAFLEAGVWE